MFIVAQYEQSYLKLDISFINAYFANMIIFFNAVLIGQNIFF